MAFYHSKEVSSFVQDAPQMKTSSLLFPSNLKEYYKCRLHFAECYASLTTLVIYGLILDWQEFSSLFFLYILQFALCSFLLSQFLKNEGLILHR